MVPGERTLLTYSVIGTTVLAGVFSFTSVLGEGLFSSAGICGWMRGTPSLLALHHWGLTSSVECLPYRAECDIIGGALQVQESYQRSTRVDYSFLDFMEDFVECCLDKNGSHKSV